MASQLAERVFRRIDTTTARELLTREEVMVLDVRDARSFEAAHIASALHVGRHNLDPLLLRTPRTTPVLIYCYHGNASRTYAQMFADFGFGEVYSLDGGYEGWRTAQTALTQANARLQTWLRQHGVMDGNVDGIADHHMTPLMQASRIGDIAVVAALIESAANVTARNADGNNALWHACLNGSMEVIDVLLGAGIDVNNQNDQGVTALMCAALRGKTTLVARLIDAGARLTLATREGLTVLDMATTIECGELLRTAAQRG